MKKSQERFKELVELLPQVVFEIDREGKWTFLNDSACQFWGKSREELIGSAFADINELKVDVSYPFILSVYNDYANKIITKEQF